MRVVLRADGSRAMGLGHVMRSLALAEEAAAEGLEVRYVVTADAIAPSIVRAHGFPVLEVEDPLDTSWLADVRPRDAVVIDGYHFPLELASSVRDAGGISCVVDDHEGGELACDVVVNPCAVPPTAYRTMPHARALTGPAFALVRREFRNRGRVRHRAEILLVTLGGSDAGALTPAVVEAVASLPTPMQEVIFVAGPGAPDPPERAGFDVVRSPNDVAAVFDRADVALATAGSTTWELLCLGIPPMLVEVADNQRLVAETARESGAATVLGWGAAALGAMADALQALADPAKCASCSEAALRTVDGRGAKRVLRVLRDVADGAGDEVP